MAATSEERLRHAKLTGAAKGLRGAVWRSDPQTAERHRSELPQVWEHIDDLIALLGDPFRIPPPLVQPPPTSADPPD